MVLGATNDTLSLASLTLADSSDSYCVMRDQLNNTVASDTATPTITTCPARRMPPR